MNHRLNDVRAELAGWYEPLDPLLVNDMDQRELFFGVDIEPNAFRRVHTDAPDAMWVHYCWTMVLRAMIRSHTPRVTSATTGLLVRPSFPLVMTESQTRARLWRLAAFADSSDDWCTENALAIRRNVAGVARLSGIAAIPEMVQRLSRFTPFPYVAHELEHLVHSIDFCGLYSHVEARRQRVERRLMFMRVEYAGDWFHLEKEGDFYRHAAADAYGLWSYLMQAVPAYERRLGIQDDDEDDEDDEDEEVEDEEVEEVHPVWPHPLDQPDDEEEEERRPVWPTMRPCPPSMTDHDDSEDKPGDVVCGICYDCDDECEKSDLSCGHAFSVSCVAKWFDTCTANGNDRTCPTCRVIPVNADYFGCHGCGRTSYQTEEDPNGLQLYTLGGNCERFGCDAVWCWRCAPGLDQCCTACGMYHQP